MQTSNPPEFPAAAIFVFEAFEAVVRVLAQFIVKIRLIAFPVQLDAVNPIGAVMSILVLGLPVECLPIYPCWFHNYPAY